MAAADNRVDAGVLIQPVGGFDGVVNGIGGRQPDPGPIRYIDRPAAGRAGRSLTPSAGIAAWQRGACGLKMCPMTDVDKNKLRWRSRRGLLELDLLLVNFVDDGFDELSPNQQGHYRRLLEEEDPDLLSWFSRSAVAEDPDFQALVEHILLRVQP